MERSDSTRPVTFAGDSRVAVPARVTVWLFSAGAFVALVAAGAHWLGLQPVLPEALRQQMLLAGLSLSALGATGDLVFGRRLLLAWMRPHLVDRRELLAVLGVALQLWLLQQVMRLCYLEHNAFYDTLMHLTLYGFIIHHFLPLRYRLLFFIALSIGGIFGVFGLGNGLWLLGLGIVLLGICRIPVAFWLRWLLVLACAGFLTAARFGWVSVPWTKAIWPILASMFMFRLIIYLYDLKHKKVPAEMPAFGRNAQQTDRQPDRPPAVSAVAYFFLLPNVAFPLFPIVDYATFCRTYYNAPAWRIYQRGIQWMVWGVLHLLVFRAINYYGVLSPVQVETTGDLMRYMVSNYLFIIKLSGQFHLVVGLLHLFGFNLPRIMDRYFLATSFTDYWRRVNVYWKEFIQKVFYYPLYFKLHRLDDTKKLLVATGFGFLVTWFFHGYQWFWIRGAFPFSIPDGFFWGSLGALMTVNAMYESRRGRRRRLVQRVSTGRELLVLTGKSFGVFVVMTVLWSIWISPSLGAWYDVVRGAAFRWDELVLWLLALFVVLALARVVAERWDLLVEGKGASGPTAGYVRMVLPTAIVVLLLYASVQPVYYYRLGPAVGDVVTDLRSNRLNAQDAALLERGYYEQLTNVHTFNSQLWELYMEKPDDWIPIEESDVVRQRQDFLRYELVPSKKDILKRATFITNRWGMRDDEYALEKPPSTYRIAMIGGSVTQGTGVDHEQTFEYLLEKRLNREQPAGPEVKYEILNFAVGGYNILQQVFLLEEKGYAFSPDALFCINHARDLPRMVKFLLETPVELVPYDEIRHLMEKAGAGEDDSNNNKLARRMNRQAKKMIFWAYSRIVNGCRERGILPVWIALPSEAGMNDKKAAGELEELARLAGFFTLNLADAYEGHTTVSLQVAPWDKHPNEIGHRILADRIYEALRAYPVEIPLGRNATNGTAADSSHGMQMPERSTQ